jgi:hypothetical protein
MNNPEVHGQADVPVEEYVRGTFVPIAHLAHGWEFHAAVSLTPAEERTMVREPAQAVPETIAARLGPLRVLAVPFVACFESGDVVAFSKPRGETHSAVWVEEASRIHVVLPCRELDAHDTGFEFLASLAELLLPRLNQEELDRFGSLLEDELRAGITGEIDEDALTAKKALLARRPRHGRGPEIFARYRKTSFVSTVAEYMHGLWHDVQIRVGADHLPLGPLRRRMNLLAELFPPNPGYRVFAEGLDQENG